MSVRRPQAKSAKFAGPDRADGTGVDHGSASGDDLAELLRALVEQQRAARRGG